MISLREKNPNLQIFSQIRGNLLILLKVQNYLAGKTVEVTMWVPALGTEDKIKLVQYHFNNLVPKARWNLFILLEVPNYLALIEVPNYLADN